MDLDFGGELSEEWIPQPASSAPPSTPGNNSLVSRRTESPQHRTGSVNATSKSANTGSFSPSLRRKVGPLSEITASDLNTTNKKRDDARASKIVLKPQHDEIYDSTESVCDGTVQIGRSPGREQGIRDATPEWRRRLVNGQRGRDEQQDLFSSRGIERIFDKPTSREETPLSQLSPSTQKKSMLPQPVAAPPHNLTAHDTPSPQRAMASSSDSRIPRQNIKKVPPINHLRSSRVERGVESSSGGRRRSHSAPRPQSTTEDNSDDPERPGSSCSDSLLYDSAERVTRARLSHRAVSGASTTEPLFSQSTGFVTTSRGNAEIDDSFFTRPLSQLSLELPTSYPISRNILKDELASGAQGKSANSPLKLFAEDDSFTSRRLHRRVSQLEVNKPGHDPNVGQPENPAGDGPSEASDAKPLRFARSARRVSNFGAGDLDGHTFEPRGSTQDLPTLEIKNEKTRLVQRTQVTTSKERRLVSQSVEKRPLGDHGDDRAGIPDQAVHADKKRILVALRSASLAQGRRPSTQDSSDGTILSIDDSSENLRVQHFSLAGRKRKDARYDNEPGASAEEIAMRAILKAKGQYQRRVSRLAASIMTQTVDGDADEFEGGRKKSLTTADFFNEANAIMQKIRAQNLPRSSLTSDNLQFSELSDLEGSLFHEEFTIEQLSRPASREGGEPRRQLTPRVLDARIVSHLRKFEDKDDLDLEWSASSKAPSERLRNELVLDESDTSNIRIRERNVSATDDRKDSETTSQGGDLVDEPAQTSSSQGSTVGSVPTGSSQGSGNKATISPDKVSHLLNATMGGMTFDPKKLCWVRQKDSSSVRVGSDPFNSDITDDDPLGDIPDLTTNESQEIRTTRELAGLFRGHAQDEAEDSGDNVRNRARYEAFDPSSTISESHRFASSGPIIETRATSWGDMPFHPTQGKVPVTSFVENTQESAQLQNTESCQDTLQKGLTARYLSICLEEPSFTEEQRDHGEDCASERKDYDASLPESVFKAPATTAETPVVLSHFAEGHDRSMIRLELSPSASLPRLAPTGSHSGSQSNYMHLALSTPQRHAISTTPTHLPGSAFHYSALHLSPLPEFTLNQPDESLNLDMDYAIKRRGLNSLPELEKNFSLAIQDLVGRITDIEPHEPYWEYMRELNLKGQRLWTLHMLSDFCSRIEELDVSKNELGQLNGAPHSLQVLSVSHNRLSGLTAWAHLPNLQYLDASYNKISSLKSFSCLAHVRELNLEGNEVESLGGIRDLGNLIRLNLRHNKLKILDLRGIKLRRLKSLDVRGNQIEQVLGLEGLGSLRDLNLRGNRIMSFSCDDAALPKSLRRLDLSSNRLTTLDLASAPSLDSLLIDRNELRYVKGLGKMRSIRKISWRHQASSSQAADNALDLGCCSQAHLLDLSENKIPTFAPQMPFLNLRKLELVSCGIEALGEDFGLQMSNLRVLNLNDNGLTDIRPLIGIEMLEELYVARNRLNKLRLTAKVVREFAGTLRYLDCRDNPATLGFYPSAATCVTSNIPNDEPSGLSLALAGPREQEGRKSVSPRTGRADDVEYIARVDEETLLRRRVYEALLLYKFKAMVFWDGLDMAYRRELDRESMWARLLELGVLTKLPPG